jgi:hypothetical protein
VIASLMSIVQDRVLIRSWRDALNPAGLYRVAVVDNYSPGSTRHMADLPGGRAALKRAIRRGVAAALKEAF